MSPSVTSLTSSDACACARATGRLQCRLLRTREFGAGGQQFHERRRHGIGHPQKRRRLMRFRISVDRHGCAAAQPHPPARPASGIALTGLNVKCTGWFRSTSIYSPMPHEQPSHRSTKSTPLTTEPLRGSIHGQRIKRLPAQRASSGQRDVVLTRRAGAIIAESYQLSSSVPPAWTASAVLPVHLVEARGMWGHNLSR